MNGFESFLKKSSPGFISHPGSFWAFNGQPKVGKSTVCNLPPSFEMEKAGVGNGDCLLQAMPHFDDLPDDKNLLGGI